jgi:proteasome lid subunit RPN8/RPN11
MTIIERYSPLTGPPPSSPTFPATWTPEIEAAAREHTAEVYPQEAAGIVMLGKYHRLENRSPTPADDVVLSDDDLLAVAGADVFFHSHPDGLPCPSETDMVYQQQLGIPFVISTWPIPDFFAFGDMLARAPLIGRAFRHGVHDCYALIRDWYAERGITALWDQPRSWSWWSKTPPQNLYTENFAKAGFVQIQPDEATRTGDLLLMAFNFAVPMHGMLVLTRDLLLHHAAGVRAYDRTRISAAVPRTRFARHTTVALRHSQL